MANEPSRAGRREVRMVEHRDPRVRPRMDVAAQLEHAWFRQHVLVRHDLPFVGLADRRQDLAAVTPRYARPVLDGVEVLHVERPAGDRRLHLGHECAAVVRDLEPALDGQWLAASKPIDPHDDADGAVAAALDAPARERRRRTRAGRATAESPSPSGGGPSISTTPVTRPIESSARAVYGGATARREPGVAASASPLCALEPPLSLRRAIDATAIAARR